MLVTGAVCFPSTFNYDVSYFIFCQSPCISICPFYFQHTCKKVKMILVPVFPAYTFPNLRGPCSICYFFQEAQLVLFKQRHYFITEHSSCFSYSLHHLFLLYFLDIYTVGISNSPSLTFTFKFSGAF